MAGGEQEGLRCPLHPPAVLPCMLLPPTRRPISTPPRGFAHCVDLTHQPLKVWGRGMTRGALCVRCVVHTGKGGRVALEPKQCVLLV